MDTCAARLARKKRLSKRQRSIVLGSLLGDGYLTSTTRGFAFRVNHGLHQKSYVDWKYSELQEFTNSAPRQSGRCYYFRTVSHDEFSEFHSDFYDSRKKVPRNLRDRLTSLALAVWVMDDGARDGNQLRINSQSFSESENRVLCSILMATFGITATLNRDKDKFRLRVSASSMPIVRQVVAPHLIPDMHYKLSP